MKTRDKIIFSIILISLGITVGKLIDFGYFEISKEIKIIEALQLFATIGIGLYITKVLEREVQNDRIEKNLLLEKISEIEKHYAKIEEYIEEKNVIYLKINNQIQQCGIKKNLIFNNLENIRLKLPIDEINQIKSNLKIKLKLMKKKMTETPVAGAVDNDISMSDGKIRYSQNRIVEIITLSNSIREEYFKLKVLINVA